MPSDARTDDAGGRDRSVDEMLEILSNYQRRAIVRHLRDSPGHVHSIDEVIAHLREIEQGKQGGPPGEDHLLSVLVHVHGPKLEESGLVDYDVPTREIRYYPNERFERLLSRIESAIEGFEALEGPEPSGELEEPERSEESRESDESARTGSHGESEGPDDPEGD